MKRLGFRRACWGLGVGSALVGGCSSTNGAGNGADGAATGTGGGSPTGGNVGIGGRSITSGTTGGTGGSSATAGSAGLGGSTTGGTSGNGGKSAIGGNAGRGDGAPPSCPEDGGTPEPAGTPPTLTAGTWKAITPPGICAGAHFGCMDMQVSPCNPRVLFVTTDSEGLWRSKDGGSIWSSVGNMPSPVSPGVLTINPRNPLEMYSVGGVRGASLGFWISEDGGDTWAEPAGFTAHADNSVDGWTNDVYDVKADPADFKHVLLTFHSGFEFTGDAGVLESLDGGSTWIRHWPRGWGAGHSVWFLGDSRTWLVGTQGNGYFRTPDAGKNWTKVSTVNMQHGGTAAFVSSTGVLYVGALSNVLRSTDNGLTFTEVAPHTSDGYYAIISDGDKLYTQLGNTGKSTVGPSSYMISDETDGINWTAQNSQTFSDGPYRMAFDPVNRILYSANWNAGVWALKVP
jgi:hypothetical protein